MLVSIPAFVAADFGGVLPWTLWATSVATFVVLGLLTPSLISRSQRIPLSSHYFSIILLLFAAIGFVQTVPAPHFLLSKFAPGSFDAYTNWLAPLERIPTDAALLQTARPMVSVDARLTHIAAWTTLLIAAFSALAALLIVSRDKFQLFLAALAITGALHAVLGISQSLINPKVTLWGIQSSDGGAPFGTFVNRSNAAVLLNAGLAGSLGLIAWRLAALTGATLNSGKAFFSELLDIFFDKTFAFALVTGSLTVIGLLTCGSRSGFVGLIGGMMLALGTVQSSNRIRGLLPTVAGLTAIAIIAIANFDLSPKTTLRVGESIEQTAETSTFTDGRFDHWPDAFTTAAKQPIVGWGWGAYRYAYLPFQKTSAASWFINADNLWLEIIVETGLPGLCLLATALIVIVRSLIKLDSGSDPMDHGIASAGWFLLGAVLVSQFFDFGLRLPSNSILVAMLFSAIVAKSKLVSGQTRDGKTPSTTLTKNSIRTLIESRTSKTQKQEYEPNRQLDNPLLLVTLLAVIIAFLCLKFNQYAHSDFAIRFAKTVIESNDSTLADLNRADKLVSQHANVNPANSVALIHSGQLKLMLARHAAAEKITLKDSQYQVETALSALSPTNLRTFAFQPWETSNETRHLALKNIRSALGQNFTEALEMVTNASTVARQQSVRALIASPLSAEARLALVSLDFAGGTTEQSVELLQQTAVLRKQNPRVLMHIGDLAVEVENHSLAAAAWKRAIVLNPSYTKQAIWRADRYEKITTKQVIPESIIAISLAVPIEIRKSNPDRTFLLYAVEELKSKLPQENSLKSEQLRIAARIEQKLGRTSDCASTLTLATTFAPSDIELRYEHAHALLRANKFTEARESARIGRQLSSDIQRFEKLIASIATKIAETGL